MDATQTTQVINSELGRRVMSRRPSGLPLAVQPLVLVALSVLVGTAQPASAQGSRATDLFSASPASQQGSVTSQSDSRAFAEPTILRQRQVRINFDSLREQLRFNLFSDAAFDGVVDSVEAGAAGQGAEDYTVRGHLTNGNDSNFTLTINQDVVVGNIRAHGGGNYQVRYLGAGQHEIRQIDDRQFPPCASGPEEHVDTGKGPMMAQDTAQSALADDGSSIDLMVVYTPAARRAAGGATSMQALIDLAVAETNDAYSASGINTQIRLAYATEVNYTESGSASTDLRRLTDTNDGIMDNVHDLRDAHGADLVSLFTDDRSSCGNAWVMRSQSASFEDHAFSVVWWNCATGYYSLGHELGHNMGLVHDRGNSSISGLESYSYGRRFTGNSGTVMRTIMGYSPGRRIQHFSNPNVRFDGQRTGVPVGQSNEADAALTIDQTAFTVANWRQAGGSPTTPEPPVTPEPSKLTLKEVRLQKRLAATTGRLVVRGDLVASSAPGLISAVSSQGMTITIDSTTAGQVASLSFNGAFCSTRAGNIKCKDVSNRTMLSLRRRSTSSSFKVRILGAKMSITPPAAADAPFTVRLDTSDDSLDSTDEIGNCFEKSRGQTLRCLALN